VKWIKLFLLVYGQNANLNSCRLVVWLVSHYARLLFGHAGIGTTDISTNQSLGSCISQLPFILPANFLDFAVFVVLYVPDSCSVYTSCVCHPVTDLADLSHETETDFRVVNCNGL
jgi:hypothetical protein